MPHFPRLSIVLLGSIALLLGACSAPAPPPAAPEAPESSAAAPSAPARAPSSPDVRTARRVHSTKARFGATLACADCAGIQLQLVLSRDELGSARYVLRLQRQGSDSGPTVRSGNWQIEAGEINHLPVAIVVLNPGNPARSAKLRINDDNSMTLLEGALNGITAGQHVRLKRSDGDLQMHDLYLDAMHGTG